MEHEMNQLDLIAQRALCLHIKSLEGQLYQVMNALDEAQKRIAELSARQPAAEAHAETKAA